MKAQEKARGLSATERAVLNETVEWMGKFLTSYALLQAAERDGGETAFDEAWGDLATALFLLKEKAEQAHALLDRD